MIPAKQPRPKTCKNPACADKFVQQRLGQAVCSPMCGLAIKDVTQDRARKAIAQRERKAIRAAKERLKSRSDYLKEAQQAFNAWVRERDAGLPCISCGTTADVQYCAGHYRPSGSNPSLRYEPLNVHLQCNRNCNMGKSGNLVEYRIELVRRIGQAAVDWLEGPHEPKKYTIAQLQEIKAYYRALVREMTKGKA